LRDSIEEFTVEKLEILCVPNHKSPSPVKINNDLSISHSIQQLMTETENEDNQDVNVTGNEFDSKMLTEVAQAKQDLLTISNALNGIISCGSISLYLTSLAIFCILVCKNVESIVVPPESEQQEGWFGWIPFFGAKSP